MAAQSIGLEAARGAAYSMAAMADAKPAPGGSGEQISSTLGQLSAAELFEIMAQMKGMIQQNPPGVRLPWPALSRVPPLCTQGNHAAVNQAL